MYTRTVDVLEAHTMEYWRISSIIQGRFKGKLTAGEAIDKVNKLEYHLGPQRTLLRSIKGLTAVIIEGKRIKKLQPATITILLLAAQSV